MQQIFAAITYGTTYKTGEIFPNDTVPLIVRQSNAPSVICANWGFEFNFKDKDNPEKSKSRLIFNARSETVYSSTTFRESAEKQRCVIPCSGFFEWSHTTSQINGKSVRKTKDKYLIQRYYKEIMYFAGIHTFYNGKDNFVILTKPANSSIAVIHDRMPLILDREDVRKYIFNDSFAQGVIKNENISPLPLVLTAVS